MKVLVTCPPMLGTKSTFIPLLEAYNIEVFCPDVVQTLSEDELINLVPQFDGWIIGDDPANYNVFLAASKGRLKAAVKWGVGIDNVDFSACKKLDIRIDNTPNMFGQEVADIAMGYVTGLARETFYIDREVRNGHWPKNRGISLANKTVGLIGLGDIGKNTLERLLAADMQVIVYDPAVKECINNNTSIAIWPDQVENCDFLVFTCALNKSNTHMLNEQVLNQCKNGVRIVNVSRGDLIDEGALVSSLSSGHTHSVALDVFQQEPLSKASPLKDYPLCILGSHNASNTLDAVLKTNEIAINKLVHFLGCSKS